ncbi:MAG: CheR family methyltransferase [bacterium]
MHKKTVKKIVTDEISDSSAPPVAGAEQQSPVAAVENSTNDFPIVGIGASAGGLASFEAFFRNMPADSESGMAFILVQHLAPSHESLLGELIRRYTTMPVYDIKDGMAIERNSVYIITPDTDLSIFHGRLHLLQQSTPSGIPLPIDHFFKSLAQEKREAAIFILFSGAGSDGTLGVRAAKEMGGMVMAQSPETAEYASLPQSAIATGLVDYVLPPENMPAQLLAYIQHSTTLSMPEDGTAPPDEALQKILLLLRAHTGHDFSGYKQNTILRRIERRIVIHQLDNLADYARYLQQTPQEATILFRELLIGVTQFFRDPDAFAVLKTQVVPQLFEGKSARDSVRVWVPGCSTGEEAYTLAILLQEYATEKHPAVKVQLFATDIDATAIEIARGGIYPVNIVSDVPVAYLGRYFIQEEKGYRLQKAIRDMVVFAEQDLILDPPFSHMDLISCRNLLIYLNGDVQKALLPLFHYALNAEGYLFLGSSETIGEFTDLFSTSQRKWKIYKRKVAVTPSRQIPTLHPLLTGINRMHTSSSQQVRPEEQKSLRGIVEQSLLEHYAPPSVLINEAEEVLYIHGSIGRYLEPASGEANLNIIRMARPGLRLELATAVRKAIAQKRTVDIKGLRMQANEQVQTLNLSVIPVSLGKSTGLYLVLFFDVPTVLVIPEGTTGHMVTADMEQHIAELERGLRTRDEYLATHVEELTTANEELQSANEELQSTNEEMDTSREELQSVNEELSTVNAELQKKIEELSQANDDMNNLLAGTDVGTVFIDRELRIKRFTPAATMIVNLIPTDIGRPIAHLATNLRHYNSLLADARQVFETLLPSEVEVQSTDGKWYLMRILPYRTRKNVVDGVVLTFVDITSLRAMQEQVRDAQLAEQVHAFAESIVETVREPLLVLDGDLHVISVNDAFIRIFKVKREETVGNLLYELGNGQWNIPVLHKLLEEVLPKHTTIRDYEVTHTFEHIGSQVMLLNARELRQDKKQPRMILLAIDVDIAANK